MKMRKIMIGIVLFYHRAKSWGFIAPLPDDPNNSVDYFVHRTGLVDRKFLQQNDKVEFDPSERDGRPLAVNVRGIDSAAPATGGQR
jgi:cold shock CspA family protein